MRATRRTGTSSELALQAELRNAGIHFEVDVQPLEGLRRRADVMIREISVAVFVDGCFWHGCEKHGTWPVANADYWKEKILTNRRRDADTDVALELAGWRVIRIWEHDDPRTCVEAIRARCQTMSAEAHSRTREAPGL